MNDAVKVLIFLRKEMIKGIRCNIVPYYDNNILKGRISFHNSDITINNVEIVIENELINDEDYRLSFKVDDCTFTLWYLPTRVTNVLYITNYDVN